MSKETFKAFASKHPELADYVENGSMTWQKFYELYDLYGESKDIWQKYPAKNNRKLTDFIDKFDADTIQKNIESLEKAIDVFKELTTKAADNVENNIKPAATRPITHFFGD